MDAGAIIELKNAVIKQAIDDWVWWQINGVPVERPGRTQRQSCLLAKQRDAEKAWKFISGQYGNLWLFTELTPDALMRIARQKLEIEKSKGRDV